MQELLKLVKFIFFAAVTAGVVGFFTAVSFWWGTYFSIRMVLELVKQVF